MSAKRNATAGVIAPPPLLYGAGLAAGLCMHRFAPRPLLPGPGGAARRVGGALIGIGLSLSIAVTIVFRKAGTSISPMRSTSRLALTGPYRYSRNPDYIGQLAVYLGITLAANSRWPILTLPAVLAVIDRGVVRREERYLQARFGEQYREYRRNVHRWL